MREAFAPEISCEVIAVAAQLLRAGERGRGRLIRVMEKREKLRSRTSEVRTAQTTIPFMIF